MEEHRRSKRVPVEISLEVSTLFKQDNVKVSNLNAPIEVKNVSKSGIGLITKNVLPIGYYFNARLQFEKEENALNCVVRIVREGKTDDGQNFYGCEFIGMASVFDYIFEDMEKAVNEAQGK